MEVREPGQKGSGQQYQISHWVEPMHMRGIGRELMDLTSQVEQISQRLLGVLSGQLEVLVRKLLSEVAVGTCKIAVLGQPKSGKSTLVNSLLGNNDLLPSNASVNMPSTSAVTRIHLGRPNAPTSGFQAHFFNKEEWENVLRKGASSNTVQKNHKSKIPMELFEKHSSTLAERVRFRLGDEFELLLGRGHSFEQSSKRILEQYISAGAESHEARPSTNIGKYSDITKFADVFLPRAPFAFPTTIIDTPGTEDPLLMRDEITRQNLQADIYILVLTADRPLSDADLSLIRILHGLRKERLVIFVNRIDELSFVNADAESIFHYVRHQIDHEFPGYNIPIILGSAHWSNMSLRNVDGIDYEGLNRALLPYAKEVGVLASDSKLVLSSDVPFDKKYLAYVLEFASGMPRLSNVISSQMLTSKHAANLAKVVRTLATVTKGIMATAQQKAESTSTALTPVSPGISGEDVMRQSSVDLSSKSEETNNTILQVKEAINKNIQSNLKVLSVELDQILDNFIEGQAYELRQVVKSVNHIDKWYVNVAALRHEIEVCCNEHFSTIKKEFHEQQRDSVDQLKQLFSDAYGVNRDDIHTSPVTIGNWEMPLDALSQVVALDLKGAWFDFIRSEAATIDAKCERLSKLIKKDFKPIIQELLNSADNELHKYLNNLIDQFFTTATAVLESAQRSQRQSLPNSEVKYLSSRSTTQQMLPNYSQSSPATHAPAVIPSDTSQQSANHARELLNECNEIERRLLELEKICLKPFKLSDSSAP